MQRQLDILSDLAQVLSEEAGFDHEGIFYKGEVNVVEGWMESTFSYCLDGKKNSVHLSDAGEEKITALVFELHRVMFDHTGGDWKWFTLVIDGVGKVAVHFEY